MSDTPKSDAAMRHMPKFFANVQARAENGKREYGDSSFEKPLPVLIEEIQQELEDVCGWSWVTWTQLEELKAKVSSLTVAQKCANCDGDKHSDHYCNGDCHTGGRRFVTAAPIR